MGRTVSRVGLPHRQLVWLCHLDLDNPAQARVVQINVLTGHVTEGRKPRAARPAMAPTQEWNTQEGPIQNNLPHMYDSPEFPKWMYHQLEPACIVETPADQAALGDGWAESPAAFYEAAQEALIEQVLEITAPAPATTTPKRKRR
jgi:hypothetical protein